MKADAHRDQIAAARWPEDAEIARALLTSYGQSLAAAGVYVAGYEEELRGLPGKYAERTADLLLARVGGEAVTRLFMIGKRRITPSAPILRSRGLCLSVPSGHLLLSVRGKGNVRRRRLLGVAG